jgi:tRNA(adenine34) deaminase
MEQANYEGWMRAALRMAREAAAADEVPVGAVVVRAGEVIACARERKVELSDPTAHAEILALREAARVCGDWRLEDCALVATLEPCPMCAGAALLARVPLLVYGAPNEKFGAIVTHVTLLEYARWNHAVETVGGVLADECGSVLREYFAAKRGNAPKGDA